MIDSLPGTLQFSNISSPVLEPLIPSLSSLGPVENPGKSRSIMNAVMPWAGLAAVGSVTAYTYITMALA